MLADRLLIHCEGMQKFKETGDLNYIFKNELVKASFAHDVSYADSKDLTKENCFRQGLQRYSS